MKNLLTIAGSDCSGGAGIQADLKTFAAHGHYGMSVITALTAQNTTGVYGVSDTAPEFVAEQIRCVFSDIRPHSVKIGMVSSVPLIEVIATALQAQSPPYLVIDPVMISTSGSRLLSEDAMEALITQLLPLATVITPNIAEAEALTGIPIHNKADMVQAAKKIALSLPVAILIKGGHLEHCADDLLYNKGEITWFSGERIDNPNTHGTGCTLSSAIASNLANDMPLEASIQKAKDYISGALRDGLNLGKGPGPLNHLFKTHSAKS